MQRLDATPNGNLKHHHNHLGGGGGSRRVIGACDKGARGTQRAAAGERGTGARGKCQGISDRVHRSPMHPNTQSTSI